MTETIIYNDILYFNPNIPDYNFEFVPTPLSAGGVGMYIDETMNYTVIERTSNEVFHALWIELQFVKQSNIICGVIYRQHNSVERFLDYFEEAVDRYSATGKPIYLLGDVNINILLAQTCNYAQQFLDCLQSYALLPTIDKPTRVCNNSATLIDNIFTNKFSEYFASGNIVSDITDHFSQFCIFQSTILTSQPAKITSRDYSKYSEQRFLQDLSQLHWESLLSGSDVDKLFSTFYINKHAPLRSLSKRKIKRLSKPWITKGIRKSIRIKNELFFSGDRDKYKFYRNKILHLSRISKRTFYHNYFTQNVCNMKKTWEGINALISHKKSNKVISRIKRPDNNLLLINWKFQISLTNILLLSDLNLHLRYRTPQYTSLNIYPKTVLRHHLLHSTQSCPAKLKLR